MRVYLGIDPGKGGGLALVADTGTLLAVSNMPATPKGIFDLLQTWSDCWNGHVDATLERVHSMPRQGVVSAFTFGQGYGGLIMALEALEISYSLVQPTQWQRKFNCLSGGDKNVTKRAAMRRFPEQTITHAIADALLIADYGRRTDWRRMTGRI
jgi:hypothetical protein